LLILITASTCSTTQVKTGAVDPALPFPYFPDPLDADGKPIPVLDGQNVTVPLWYWIKITEYAVDVEKCREIYEAWKNIYLEEKPLQKPLDHSRATQDDSVMYGIIYKATSPDGKVYIGKTEYTLATRKRQHAFRAKVNDKRTTFQLAILEHGGVNAFKWVQIDTAETEAELNAKEEMWVDHYKADNPEYGYNIFKGGANAKHTAETKRKISEAQKGRIFSDEHRRKIREAKKNIFPETCRKLSESHKGKHLTAETRRKQSKAHRGEKAPAAKLTEAQVRQIKIALARGASGVSLARQYGVSAQIVSDIKRGKAWAWLEVA